VLLLKLSPFLYRDHDEEVLDSIAAHTSGTFTFIRDNCEVKEAVALSLGGALSVALQATTVELTSFWSQGVAILGVSAGVYEATVDEAQASASVALKVRSVDSCFLMVNLDYISRRWVLCEVSLRHKRRRRWL
jgi:hypothetical protein